MKNIKLYVLLACFWFTGSGFLVIGHRGAPHQAPEETFQSDQAAFQDGANYVELDLHVSQDNVLVVSHDRNLQRVTGNSLIVSQTPWSIISQLKQANGEPMHSLAQLFAHFQNQPATKFLIETKVTKAGNPKNMEALLAQTITRYHMQKRVMVHSFSYISLLRFKKLMPSVPTIFIAGSLKRLNFEVLQNVTGVNISSQLVSQKLINQLHYLGKKVFVWDEMNESPSQWNWLVNLPIDGVVTNYPTTGSLYRDAKAEATIDNHTFTGILTTTYSTTSIENPYTKRPTSHLVTPLTPLTITQTVTWQGQRFYRLSSREFISAVGVNRLAAGIASDFYLGKILLLKSVHTSADLYPSPLAAQTNGQQLPFNKGFKIEAVQRIDNRLWFKTRLGWLPARETKVTLQSNFNTTSVALKRYLLLNSHERDAVPNFACLFVLTRLQQKQVHLKKGSQPFTISSNRLLANYTN